LQLSVLFPPASAWAALESGSHALDLTTVAANCKSTWFKHGFAAGVFVADDDDGSQWRRCFRHTYTSTT
jgi:hypothetical protein